MALEMKYFVLKPTGDSAYSDASRAAIIAYAEAIRATDEQMADELEGWIANVYADRHNASRVSKDA